MKITSKNENNKIKVIVEGVEIGEIIGAQKQYILIDGNNNMKWKILYSNFV